MLPGPKKAHYKDLHQTQTVSRSWLGSWDPISYSATWGESYERFTSLYLQIIFKLPCDYYCSLIQSAHTCAHF